MKTKTNHTWANSTETRVVKPKKFLIPKSLEDLKKAVAMAEADGVQIRAVGSGHSFSDVPITEDYMVEPEKLNRFLDLDIHRLKPAFQSKRLVEVEGGMTIRDFNKELDKRELAIPNMGGIDHQKLAGAINTGTHGTGIKFGSVASMVRSVVIVTSGAKVYRIEPSDGISDPTHRNEPGIELLQDDKAFHSVVVGLGCMGLVYSYILEVYPMYYLHEAKTLFQLSELEPHLRGGVNATVFELMDGIKHTKKYNLLGGFIRGVMLAVSPYINDKGDQSCVLTRHFNQTTIYNKNLFNTSRNWISSVGGSIKHGYEIAMDGIKKNPSNIPNTIETAIWAMKDNHFIHRAHKVLYQGSEYIKERAFDAEIAFDLDKHDLVEVIKNISAKIREQQGKGWYLTAPMGVRYVAAEEHYMVPNSGRNVAYIDIPFLLGVPWAFDMLDVLQDYVYSIGGIPHWGKINNRIGKQLYRIPEWYPHYDDWKDSLQRFNSSGVFNSPFTERLGISVTP